MRKILLAGAAILGTAGGSWAQTYQSQGTQALPWTNFYGANTNINANGTAQPGGVKLPDPGTVVIHLNGRVWGDVDLSYSSLANVSAAAGSSGVRYKSNPIGVASYLRLYPGFDGVATNGLRYGAGIVTLTYVGPRGVTCVRFGLIMKHVERMSPCRIAV